MSEIKHEFVPWGFPEDDRCRFPLGMDGYGGGVVYCDLPKEAHGTVKEQACGVWFFDFVQCELAQGHKGQHRTDYLDATDGDDEYWETYEWDGAGMIASRNGGQK